MIGSSLAIAAWTTSPQASTGSAAPVAVFTQRDRRGDAIGHAGRDGHGDDRVRSHADDGTNMDEAGSRRRGLGLLRRDGGVDGASRSHIVAACNAGLRYAVSNPEGAWSTTLITQPANRKQMDPQIGFDGDVVYVAYSWLAVTDGGCEDDGLDDLGVYHRQRTLPDGVWSEPKRIGIAKDMLVSFRVEGRLSMRSSTTRPTEEATTSGSRAASPSAFGCPATDPCGSGRTVGRGSRTSRRAPSESRRPQGPASRPSRSPAAPAPRRPCWFSTIRTEPT
jgi:hypothetical protein